MKPRIERLKSRLDHHGLDALLVSSATNIRYLFGFTGSNAIALISSGPSFFVTDRRYRQQSGEQVHDAEIIIAQKDLYSELQRVSILTPGYKVGVEVAHLPVKSFFHLKKILPNVKLLAAENLVEKIASIKEPAEIENIRRAGGICQSIFREVCSVSKPGMRELELSAEISYRAMRAGSERDPFEPIVASGKRSALPHGISTSKVLETGDLVIVDFGATINGYAADFTRTVVLGELTKKYEEMARVVLQALCAAESAARPGMSGKQLDQVARDSIEQEGYGDYFQHSLGHGLGLNVHAMPRISEQSEDALEVGQVITLEPGVYVPEVGGVRIEDDFYLTEPGLENLTPCDREVVCVG
ncbi:MAG: M24 family metallopeptidase [bacterium]